MRALLIIGRKHGSDALELLNPTSSYQQSVVMQKDIITRMHSGDKTYAVVNIYEAEPTRVLRPRVQTEIKPTEKKGKK